jgi:hypothetical protein
MVYMVYMVYMFVFLVPRLHDPTINFFNGACVYFLYTSCVFGWQLYIVKAYLMTSLSNFTMTLTPESYMLTSCLLESLTDLQLIT